MKRKTKVPNDMKEGMVFKTKSCGLLRIKSYQSCSDVTVEFERTGTVCVATAGNIRNGEVKDKFSPDVFGVGYMGDGKYTSRINGKIARSYSAWTSMIERCYCETRHKKQPTYKECTVCDEWMNFQNFAKWFYDNYPNDGQKYQLDKDILVKGNKIYSPETCIFVTSQENSEEARAINWKFTSPCGEIVDIYNLSKFCNENNLDQGSMVKVYRGERNHHKGWRRA